ncbi:MAG: chemotaxis protein CheA [Bacillota bacterium]
MTSNYDMSQYLSIFLDEVDEQIQIMDENILSLEKNRKDKSVLNSIFRAAHTIKGSSASMGYEKMAEVTHNLENVLDLLRQDKLTVSTEIIDLLLECLDIIKALKNDIINERDTDTDISVIAKMLKTVIEVQEDLPQTDVLQERSYSREKGYLEDKYTVEFNDIEENVIRTAEIKGYKVWQIIVSLVSDCLMKAARAYIVYNNLKDLGEIIKTIPSTEDLEGEKFDLEFQMFIVTKEDRDRIENIVKSISEIDKVVVRSVELNYEIENQEKSLELSINEAAFTKELGPLLKEDKSTPGQSESIKINQTVRVDVQRLENLMNLVGELVIDRIRLADIEASLGAKYGSEELLGGLEEISLHISRITGDLQEEIMKARMFPIEQVFNRFPRMVRDLASKAGKQIDFIIEGRETELDRTIIEEIGDPLIHLLRNAVDHGIEPPDERVMHGKPAKGTIKLRAYQQENQIVITIEDDGKGIDPNTLILKALEKGLISEEKSSRISQKEALNLIFISGFSTAEKVSTVSGRGVGMDIVKNHIERINGMVKIHSVPGKGTKFTIKLPLTLAINRSLLVKYGNEVFAFPLANIVEIVNIVSTEIKYVAKQEVVLVRGEILPLYYLEDLLELKYAKPKRDKFPVVVVGLSERQVGIVVDELIGEQEIVIKSLGDYIGKINGLAGATIMGNGTVALILDVRGIMEQVRMDD